MKNAFVSLFFAAVAISSPLGDRALFTRHSDLPRNIILRSDLQGPKVCSNKNSPPLPPAITNVTDPSLDNTTIPDANGTLPDANSTLPDANDTLPDASDNSTSTDNSTDTSSTSRRHLSVEVSEWQTLCSVSGGGIYSNFDLDVGLGCVNWAGIDAVSALYAEADPCEQQFNADFMITWAKEFGGVNTHQFIAQAIRYRQYPRRVVKVLDVLPSSPYCLLEPVNIELYGIYNEQLPGVDYGLYGGPNYPLVSFGGDGTCPFSWIPDVSACTCVSQNNTSSITDATSTLDSSDPTATDVATDVATTTQSADDSAVTDSSADATDSVDGSEDPSATSDSATDASSTAADASATAGLSGDINDPNGR